MADADEIKVVLNNDHELAAEIVGTDPKTDIAVIKVKFDKTIKPEFVWKIAVPKPVQFDAEIAYTAFAIHWFPDYNIITAEDSDLVQMLGWMTIDILDDDTGKPKRNKDL